MNMELYAICTIAAIMTLLICTGNPHIHTMIAQIIHYLRVWKPTPPTTTPPKHIYPPAPPRVTERYLQAVANAAVTACRETFGDFDARVRNPAFIIVVAALVEDVGMTPNDLALYDKITKSFDVLGHLQATSMLRLEACLHRILPGHRDPLNVVYPTWKTIREVVAIAYADVHQNRPADLALRNNPISSLDIESILSDIMHLYPPPTLNTRPFPHQSRSIPSMFRFLPTILDEDEDLEAGQRTRHWAPRVAHGFRRVGWGAGRTNVPNAGGWVRLAAGLILAEILSQVDAVGVGI